MTVLHQPSMFDIAEEPELSQLRGRIRRTELTDGAWVDHLPGWLLGSDQLLDSLLADVPWRAERRQMYDREVDVPRLLCWYSGEAPLPHPVLTAARDQLNEHYSGELGEPFVTAGLCLYRDGADSVAWHGDTIGRGAHTDTMVAILSVGSARSLMLRPRRGGSPEVPAGTRRPDRDGWQLPADLGARDPENRAAGRPAGEHPIPPGRRRLTGDQRDAHESGQRLVGAAWHPEGARHRAHDRHGRQSR